MTGSDETTRRRVLLGIGAGTTVALAGCSGGGGGSDDTTEPDMDGEGTDGDMGEDTTDGGMDGEPAMVRVSHMSPNAPNVDVYVDGSAVLEDVAFGTTSDYLELAGGEHTVEITAAGDQSTSVFEDTVSVMGGTAYTVVANGEIGEDGDEPFTPLILEDDLSSPGSNSARLRLVHASPDAPAVDVTVNATGDAIFDGVAFGETASVEVEANDYTVEIRGDTESNDGDVVADYDVSLNGGTVYTAFAAGYLTPDDEPQDNGFELIVAQDASTN